MAEFSGPWNDQVFGEDRWRQLWASTLAMARPVRLHGGGADGLTATGSPSNRNISVSPGLAVVQGFLYESDDTVVLDNTAPAAGQLRIDYVALRLDPAEPDPADRIKLVLIQGTPHASNPQPPTLEQDQEGVFEFPIYRFGPHGNGPMGSAPRMVMTAAYTPMQVISDSNRDAPNIRAAGLSKIPGALVFNQQGGHIHRYSGSQYVWAQQPLYGTIGAASGWQASSGGRAPQWRLDRTGLVTLKGSISRSSATAVSLPQADAGNGLIISAALPASVRPATSTGRYHITSCQLALTSGGGTMREPVRLQFDGSTGRLDIVRVQRDARWIRQNSTVILDGMTWWVE